MDQVISTNPFDDLEDEEEEEEEKKVEEKREDGITNDSTNPFSISPSPSNGIELIDEHWRDLSDLMDMPITNPFALQEFKDHLTCINDIMTKEQLQHRGGSTSECLELLLSENMLEKIYLFTNKQRSYSTDTRIALLGFLTNLLSLPGAPPLFIHQQILRPLNRLLRICEMSHEDKLTNYLLPLLHRICELIQENETFLDLFFTDGAGQVPSKFLIFSQLVLYLHDSTEKGTRARDAILLCLSVAGRSPQSSLCDFIVADTDFCQVLATGLSGLYSSLPTTLIELTTDDWSSPLTQLQSIAILPQLKLFMQALQYCNSVLQMAPLLVCQAVTSMIKNGFLQQVLGPAILQPFTNDEPSTDEATVAIGYLCLFLHNITNVQLLRVFLQFILLGKVDGLSVCNALIQYLSNDDNKLVAMTLELFYIILNLNCEDVLLVLILQYLLPGLHVTSSQLASISKRDLYCTGARKVLELIPQCCVTAEEMYLESLLKDPSSRPSSPATTNDGSRANSPEGMASICSSQNEVVFEYISPQKSYYNYLIESRLAIEACAQSCSVWSSTYNECVTSMRPAETTPTSVKDTPALIKNVDDSLSIVVPSNPATPIFNSADKSPRSKRKLTSERFTDEAGLFLKVLMDRLSLLLSNSPLINELIMKLISRLLHYPQPLLRSFLITYNLVLKPGIPNLLHVLQDLKQTIDKLAKERETFPSRLGRARKTLIFQNAITNGIIDENTASKISAQLRTRSDSHLSDSTTNLSPTNNETPTKDDRGSERRRRAYTEGSRNLSEIRKRKKKYKVTINMVYGIVMYGEWLKELASLSQEHSIINPDLLILNNKTAS